MNTIIQEGLKEVVRTIKETDATIDSSEEYALMDAYKLAAQGINPDRCTMRLAIMYDEKEYNLIRVSLHDPMAVSLIRDQIIAVISGLLSRKK